MVTSCFSAEFEAPHAHYNIATASRTSTPPHLRPNSSPASKSKHQDATQPSPMTLLHRKLRSVFRTNPHQPTNTNLASAKLNAIKSTLLNNHWTITKLETEKLRCRQLRAGGSYTVSRDDTCWTLCSTAASLVMVLAAPQADAKAAFQFPGHDTRAEIAAGRPSANMRREILRMQGKASAEGRTMALAVGLVDCCDRARRYDAAYTTFNHWFVLVVGPEGLRVYQSWLEQYSLVEWLESDGARLRNREEVKELLEQFDVLETPQDEWTDTLNSAYHACFDVDISALRRKNRRSKRDSTISPPKLPYRPYFSVSYLDEIIALDIDKFKWECTTEANPNGDNSGSNSHAASCDMGAIRSGPYRPACERDPPAKSPRRSMEGGYNPPSVKSVVWPGPLERFMW